MPERLTPLLAQYRRIKEAHQGAILLFRVGDFYEMFYEDAEAGARALNLTLTSRPHGPHNRVPLAGVPAKALDTYLSRLVAQGFKVAVCDQLELPAPGKPVVKRDVVEVLTPGTVTTPNLLDARRNNYLLALAPTPDRFGLAFADVSTAEFFVAEVPASSVAEEVQKLAPAEVLLPQSTDAGLVPDLKVSITRLDDYYFTQDYAFDKLASHFGVANLDGFGVAELTEGVCAAGAVLHYLGETQRSTLPHIRRIAPYRSADGMLIDRISRRNLELVERIHAEDADRTTNTLFAVLDRTRTPMGTRCLRRWLLAPLLDVERIRRRQDAVAELSSAGSCLTEVQAALARLGDLERVSSRVALERCHARDLVGLAAWLKVVPEIKRSLAPLVPQPLDPPIPRSLDASLLQHIHSGIEDFASVVQDIEGTLADDPPLATNEGGLIRTGTNPELDELRQLARDAKTFIARLQETERQRTGISNLRVAYNSVFGYYIEVTKSWLERVPKNYLRKQTVANGERFITPELKEYEARVLNAEERSKRLEYELFCDLRRRVAREVTRILALSALLAELDALSSMAQVARENNYVRPVVDDSTALEIKAGRHPVVEQLLAGQFIPNDTALDRTHQQIVILTGPNMAGKSTYLRQVALITIMAQVGSFVPAEQARIGIVDKVFTRIGASDDLARGVSTFLAEMTETANILNNATDRSLVILDEVGRGTSTSDGLALAWAAVEYLHGGGLRPEASSPGPTDLQSAICNLKSEI
ncbi:DNA mismatch repair protein MutS, partial [candidate division WOR-3 bacterium]|nr:DNA mismatch repair protein MutS [candidate division WOR-3 bacterium]